MSFKISYSCLRLISGIHFSRSICSSASSTSSTTTKSTVEKAEIERFRKLSAHWWNRNGPFKALHAMNELRVPFITNNVIQPTPAAAAATKNSSIKPLTGLSILDIGCGGGILSEALYRLGADVTGIDADEESISVAQGHAQKSHVKHQLSNRQNNLSYLHTNLEDVAEEYTNHFDCLVASEVIEHVADPVEFVKLCVHVVKPEGHLFFTTINRTRSSYWLAIQLAENVLHLLPKGTHDWNKFIPPSDLVKLLQIHGAEPDKVTTRGTILNPLTGRWSWTGFDCVNYALHAVKRPSV